MGRRLVTGVLVVCCLLPAGCGKPDDPEPERELTTLRINGSTYQGFAPLAIGVEEGYFAEQGIALDVVTLRSSSQGIPSLVRGELDVLSGALLPGVLNSIARNAPIKMVADKGSIPSSGPAQAAAFVTPDLAQRGPLDDAETLRGIKVATIKGTPTGFFLYRLLARAGLQPEDVELCDVPVAARVDALQRGIVDAVTAPAPWSNQLMDADFAVLWATDVQVTPGLQFSFLAFGPRLLEEEPDLGHRFIAGYLAAVRQYNEGKTARNLDILTEHTAFDRETLQRIGWTEIRADGRLDVDDVLEFQEWAAGEGLIDRVLKPEEFWDPRFVEHAAGTAAEGR
jgi:NitT/TauT family transport system substrate-binding protein